MRSCGGVTRATRNAMVGSQMLTKVISARLEERKLLQGNIDVTEDSIRVSILKA